jgi:2-polyprenyl-3-methyl-5-hydroxy-6-metoxy-1,4-benzoquinol methylase
MFRFPKENSEQNLQFYQSEYEEGLTTDLPEPPELAILINAKFKGSVKDFSDKIELIRPYLANGRVLDYGCSWGYGAWQFIQAGYDVVAFEISQPRASYGRKNLGVNIISNLDTLNDQMDGSFDLIFTSHVLEHMPDISTVFSLFSRLLRSGGTLSIFVPNCNDCDLPEVFERKKNFAFGEKHTIAYDSSFLSSVLQKHNFDVKLLKDDSFEIQIIAQRH